MTLFSGKAALSVSNEALKLEQNGLLEKLIVYAFAAAFYKNSAPRL
jgi:hypothetical protein